MATTVVATLRYSATGLTLPLEENGTLVLGRGSQLGIADPHISRKQLEIMSKDQRVFAVRRGTNASQLNGADLPKDTPVAISDGDKITLLGADHLLTVVMDVDVAMASVSSASASGGSSSSHARVLRSPQLLTPPPQRASAINTSDPHGREKNSNKAAGLATESGTGTGTGTGTRVMTAKPTTMAANEEGSTKIKSEQVQVQRPPDLIPSKISGPPSRTHTTAQPTTTLASPHSPSELAHKGPTDHTRSGIRTLRPLKPTSTPTPVSTMSTNAASIPSSASSSGKGHATFDDDHDEENTSESDTSHDEDRLHPRNKRRRKSYEDYEDDSDVSQESSVICEDLSDLDVEQTRHFDSARQIGSGGIARNMIKLE